MDRDGTGYEFANMYIDLKKKNMNKGERGDVGILGLGLGSVIIARLLLVLFLYYYRSEK